MLTTNNRTFNRIQVALLLLLILSSFYVPVVLAEAAGTPTPT